MRLYVGNLPFKITEAELSDLFSQCGVVDSVRIITDRDTGRSRGFAFVEFASKTEGEAAIQKFAGMEFAGRALTVNEAKPLE
ncbi:MAG: RNA-binding protein, partial [Blastocatellia bacterium]